MSIYATLICHKINMPLKYTAFCVAVNIDNLLMTL